MTSEIYTTVDYYGDRAEDARPLCQGCMPEGIATTESSSTAVTVPVRARYRVVGASGDIDLCLRCAVNVVKSISARFMMYDRRADHELRDFFAVAVKTTKTAKKRKTKKAARKAGSVDVLPRGARVPPKRNISH